MAKYSFILPAYKRQFLAEAIGSILAQTYTDFELVVVDDCSPEDLQSVVATFQDPRLSYHRNTENLGRRNLVASWNHALQYACGEYVILASDDDVYLPEFLSEVDILALRYPAVDEIRARVERIDEKGNVVDTDQLYSEFMPQTEFMFWLGKGLIDCMANHVFRTAALKSVGWCIDFPCAWFSDDATALIMASNGIAHTQKPLFRFRRSDINVSATINIPVLKQKVIACRQYYDWAIANLPTKSIDGDMTAQEYVRAFQFRLKERCMTDLSRSYHKMPLRQLPYILKQLSSIPWLYSKEKVMLFTSFLIGYHKD